MSGHFTDRDERMWQRRAEETAARPLPIGAWLKALRVPRPGGTRAVRPVSASARPRPAEQA
ncbi:MULTISPECIES: hypothetical protein [unclassified Streptomyces]|uniref:hypothetical protein n=1 Tax=unclassified Streptomyces TaxID=2593676 RepID=UPI0006F5F988|nr:MULTISPECIES: hypothetical protein [unclassified Streptomyces]KQX49900.1 hypothetical protein ASD33_14720 [Streptomyces sp. Root1304]KRA80057.1 hypothetical protein ASE09_18190 [Streptomyces sp. Root66D1]